MVETCSIQLFEERWNPRQFLPIYLAVSRSIKATTFHKCMCLIKLNKPSGINHRFIYVIGLGGFGIWGKTLVGWSCWVILNLFCRIQCPCTEQNNKFTATTDPVAMDVLNRYSLYLYFIFVCITINLRICFTTRNV